MSTPEVRRETEAAPDRQNGRVDNREGLRLKLASAPADYLEGALDNPEFGPDELAFVLRNRSASARVLGRIGRNRAWMRSREAKVGLIAHPKTPVVLARTFLPHLTWRQLAEVASDLRLSPVLRREAERIVLVRLPELSAGERITLARLASRGLVELLRDESDARVMCALVSNARATEPDVTRMVARRDAPVEFLIWLAEQSAWGQRRTVRLALLRHPRTPAPAALRLASALSTRDLAALARDASVPRLVRVAAERRALEEGAHPSRPELG